jgi:hypothetical protein
MRIVVIGLLCCGVLVGAVHRQELSDEETAAIYIAALNGETRQDPPREAALNRHLMTSSGYYTPSGLMPMGVVERLRAQGLFSELCGEGPSSGAGPECISQRARAQVRLSRPIARGADTVDVYIGSGSVRALNDTSTVFYHLGSTLRCRIVREQSRWIRRGDCEVTMMT